MNSMSQKDFLSRKIKVIGTTCQITYTNLLIIFLEFLKHRVEFFLLLGRYKLWAGT
jgi:hypothetical protein